jgi:hypothetical protein
MTMLLSRPLRGKARADPATAGRIAGCRCLILGNKMIIDTTVLQTLQTEWQGVLKLKGKVDLLLKASFTQGASAIARMADIPHNLPFLAAL